MASLHEDSVVDELDDEMIGRLGGEKDFWAGELV